MTRRALEAGSVLVALSLWPGLAGCGGDLLGDASGGVGAGAAPRQVQARYEVHKLYYYADPAPGGKRFWQFAVPGLTDSGVVFFRASLLEDGGTIDPHHGVWAGPPGDVQLVIKEGDAAPGIPGHVLQYIHEVAVTRAGTIGLHSSFQDPAAPVSYIPDALWMGRPGAWSLVARYGEHAPGTDPGFGWVEFAKSLDLGADWLSDAGGVAFFAHAFDAATPAHAYGIWAGPPGGLERVLSIYEVSDPVMNESGAFAFFQTNLASAGLWQYLFVRSAGTIRTVASKGQTIPGGGAALGALHSPLRLNGAGEVAFAAFIDDPDDLFRNDRGLFVGPPGGLELLVRGNDLAAGVPGATHQACCIPDVNDHGVAVFFDYIAGEGIGSAEGNGQGIWSGTPGDLQLVARAGDLVPGAAGDVRFGSFSQPIINDAGEVAFLAILAGNDVPNYGTFGTESLWVGRPGDLTMIAMEGDVVAVNGQNLPIKAIEFPAAGSATASNTPKTRGLNDLGQLVFQATFEGEGTTLDKTAVFLATPTAPRLPVADAGPDRTVEATSPGGAAVTLDGSRSRDPAGGAALTYRWEGPFGVATGANPTVVVPLGTHAITLVVTATGPGTTDTDAMRVTVVDTTPPQLGPAQDLVGEAAGPGGAVMTFALSATDLVSGTLAAACNPGSGSLFPLGTTHVTCTATDGAGNRATTGFRVEVRDTTAPAIAAPADVTAEATAALTPMDLGEPEVEDLVDPSPAVTSDAPSGGFPVGETPVTWTATDARGNTSSAIQLVTITDTTPPLVTPPPDVFVHVAGPLTDVALGTPTAHDLVDGDLVPIPDRSGPFAPGTHQVTWSATDSHGNTGTATQTVVVQYDFVGFLGSVRNPPQTNVVYAGDVVLVNWRIPNPLGGFIGDTGIVTGLEYGEVACDAIDPLPGELHDARRPDQHGACFQDWDGHFTFEWWLDRPIAEGCYLFLLSLDDGTVHQARFEVKRR